MQFEAFEYLIPFLFAAIVLAFLPGPSLMYVLARTINGGREAGIESTIGTAVGGMVHVLIAALGLSAVLANSIEVFSAVKFIGALYLVFLGVRTIFGAREAIDSPARVQRKGQVFYEGALTEILNVKTALFFLAFIPQFVDPTTAATPQFVALGVVCVFFNAVADLTVVFFAGKLSALLEGSSNFSQRLSYGSGGMLVLLGVYTAFADIRK